MALDFPNNPSIDDEYTAANTTWKWDEETQEWVE